MSEIKGNGAWLSQMLKTIKVWNLFYSLQEAQYLSKKR